MFFLIFLQARLIDLAIDKTTVTGASVTLNSDGLLTIDPPEAKVNLLCARRNWATYLFGRERISYSREAIKTVSLFVKKNGDLSRKAVEGCNAGNRFISVRAYYTGSCKKIDGAFSRNNYRNLKDSIVISARLNCR